MASFFQIAITAEHAETAERDVSFGPSGQSPVSVSCILHSVLCLFQKLKTKNSKRKTRNEHFVACVLYHTITYIANINIKNDQSNRRSTQLWIHHEGTKKHEANQ